MEYESDILKRLIKTYGVVGNPRYISEIIKEFIVRGKGRFPELFTYQSDWLAHIDVFGLNPTYMVSYTGQSIYTPNSLERPVKSAILKGNTLENLTYGVQLPLTQNSVDFRVKGMESGKKYTIFYDVEAASSTNLPKVGIVGQAKENSGANWLIYQSNIPLGTGKVVLTMPSFYSISFLRIHKNDSLNEPITLNNLMLLEGDYTNDDIPFFDGIQSVKMPVLTTVGKNLFTESLLDEPSKKIIDGEEYFISTFKLDGNKIDNKKQVTFSFDVINQNNATWCNVYIEYSDYQYATIKGVISSDRVSLTSREGKTISCIYFISESGKEVYIKNIQLEYNSTSTTYEPYKSNILTVNEDVTLRSNGDICDELNLLTGQLTQRIGEDGVVLSQEVVKTVDLTILDQNGQNVKQLMSFNGGTHFNTGSLEGSLPPSVSVTVETDLEETLKVCSLEGNTL